MDDKFNGLLVVAVIIVFDVFIISLWKLLFGKPKKQKETL